MNLLRTRPDREFVDIISREQRFRKPAAWFLLTLMLIEVTLFIWCVLLPYPRFHSSMVNNPVWRETDPVMNDLLKNSYEIGMIMGGMLTIFVGSNLTGVFVIIAMMFGGRRDRLLTRCYRKLHGCDPGAEK